jgi:hypothetical protein
LEFVEIAGGIDILTFSAIAAIKAQPRIAS